MNTQTFSSSATAARHNARCVSTFLIILFTIGFLLHGETITAEDRILFEDRFEESSRNLLVPNLVSQAAPEGMEYKTDTPNGYVLKNWLIADEEPDGPRRCFWCIPVGHDGNIQDVMKQVARSRNSICYARTMIPDGAKRYTIEFRQRCNDNDYIGFILGASQPLIEHDGFEFGYSRQIPGTDETVDDAYYKGDLGEGKILGQAKMKQWASHRIEVDGQSVSWYQDEQLMLTGKTDKSLRGYLDFVSDTNAGPWSTMSSSPSTKKVAPKALTWFSFPLTTFATTLPVTATKRSNHPVSMPLPTVAFVLTKLTANTHFATPVAQVC